MRRILPVLTLLGSTLFAQNPVYLKNLGGSTYDMGTGVLAGPVSGSYFTGTFNGTADLDPGVNGGTVTSAGGRDAYFAKYTNDGAFVWGKAVGGSSADEGVAMVSSNDNGLFLAGTYTFEADMDPGPGITNLTVAGTNNSSIGTFIARYTTNGDLVWARSLSGINAGCYVAGMARDGIGNLYVTGWYTGPVDFDPSGNSQIFMNNPNTNSFVAKYDGDGNLIWARQIGGSAMTRAYSIYVNGSGSVLLGGYYDSGTCDVDPGAATVAYTAASGVRNGWAIKLTTDGQYAWSADLAGDNTCTVKTVLLDAPGNAFLGGTFSGTYDFNPGPDITSFTSDNSQDAFLMKLSGTTGTLTQAVPFQGFFDEDVSLMTLGNDGSLYFSGATWGDSDLDPGPGTVFPTLELPVFFCHYSTSMTYLGHYGWSDLGNIIHTSMDVDLNGQMISTGRFDGTIDLNTGSGSFPLTAVGEQDAFIASFGDINVGFVQPVAAQGIGAFPNPSKGMFHLTLPYPEMTVTVTDDLGRTVFKSSNMSSSILDISLQPAGVYLITAWNDKFSAAQKVLVE